ncbi:hypothetical protein GQ43DRAFT_434004 [Delitschia confertaspora ATCC 74209]|uniref:Uncharacterized protein n=1 Tax=Delitschia confertaspora ATCC 74209 TaxID=1513339 RepID=A0A9P4JLP7_9PLEO|nr:hypothetical protein GQ43DRAFT_434004 [Delitschia confertaspora ATCC 74209]
MPISSSVVTLIDDYYNQKPNFSEFLKPFDDPEKKSPTTESERENLQQPQKESYAYLGGKEVLESRRIPDAKMPVHPAEENASGSITDQVAKDSKDSTASSAPLHDVDTGATSGGSEGASGDLYASAHKGNPGPVIAENIGEPASKEELKKRAEELNKK